MKYCTHTTVVSIAPLLHHIYAFCRLLKIPARTHFGIFIHLNLCNQIHLWKFWGICLLTKSQNWVVFCALNQSCAGGFYCWRWQRSLISLLTQVWCGNQPRFFIPVALAETSGTGKGHFSYLTSPRFPDLWFMSFTFPVLSLLSSYIVRPQSVKKTRWLCSSGLLSELFLLAVHFCVYDNPQRHRRWLAVGSESSCKMACNVTNWCFRYSWWKTGNV